MSDAKLITRFITVNPEKLLTCAISLFSLYRYARLVSLVSDFRDDRK